MPGSTGTVPGKGDCWEQCRFSQELSGTPSAWYFLKRIAGTNGRRTAVQIGGVLHSTDWRCTAAFPFLRSSEASKAQRYKWEAYCGTNWRCTASTFQTSCTGWGFLNSPHSLLFGVFQTVFFWIPHLGL